MRKRIETSVQLNDGGKMPPQAVDIEEVVIGALLLEESAFYEVSDVLVPDIFYKESHQLIVKAIISLKNKNDNVDILTVTQELKRTGEIELVGGAYAISMLTNRLASSANILAHIKIVQEMYALRETIRCGVDCIKSAYDVKADFVEVIGKWEGSLVKLTDKLFSSKTATLKQLNELVLKDNAIMRSSTSAVVGVPTGFIEMDIVTGGWQDSDLIILAARPGMGKTGLALCYARTAALKGTPVALFSLEMSALQLYKRMISQETWIPLDMLTKKGMDEATEQTFIKESANFINIPLYIEDTAYMTIYDLKNKCRKLKREKGVKLIIIDYIQLMSSGSEMKGNREQEISFISRNLKLLAKELQVPIIALSQLSRQTENRPGNSKRPQLSDLRDSGAIEQDADMVQFIYRPEYYGIEVDENNESTRGMAQVIVAKNRHGATTDIALKWIGENVLFLDIDHQGKTIINQQVKALETNNDFMSQGNSDDFNTPPF